MNSTQHSMSDQAMSHHAVRPLRGTTRATRRTRWVGIGMTLVALPATALAVALSAPAAQAWPSIPTPHITIPTAPVIPTPVYTVPPLPTGLPTPPATPPATPTPTPSGSASPSSPAPSSGSGSSGSGSGSSGSGTGAGSAGVNSTAPTAGAAGDATVPSDPAVVGTDAGAAFGGGPLLPAIFAVGILALLALAGLGWFVVRGRGTRSSGPGV